MLLEEEHSLNCQSWGWSDGTGIRSITALSEDQASAHSTHTAAHKHQQLQF